MLRDIGQGQPASRTRGPPARFVLSLHRGSFLPPPRNPIMRIRAHVPPSLAVYVERNPLVHEHNNRPFPSVLVVCTLISVPMDGRRRDREVFVTRGGREETKGRRSEGEVPRSLTSALAFFFLLYSNLNL